MARRLALATCILLLLATLPGVAIAQYSTYEAGSSTSVEEALAQRRFRRLEVLMEIGAAMPLADLAADADETFEGFGQFPGFVLGVRTRVFLARTLALAPYIAYTEFGEAETTLYDRQFLIQSKVLDFGLDFTWVAAGEQGTLRPLLAAGLAFTRNKYREEDIEAETVYKDGVNVLTAALTAGLRWRDWELTAYYQFNTLSTARFYPTGAPQDYDWGHVLIRLGYVLPEF